jgi:hypothetical protein
MAITEAVGTIAEMVDLITIETDHGDRDRAITGTNESDRDRWQGGPHY